MLVLTADSLLHNRFSTVHRGDLLNWEILIAIYLIAVKSPAGYRQTNGSSMGILLPTENFLMDPRA
jgi:hypothetical protein